MYFVSKRSLTPTSQTELPTPQEDWFRTKRRYKSTDKNSQITYHNLLASKKYSFKCLLLEDEWFLSLRCPSIHVVECRQVIMPDKKSLDLTKLNYVLHLKQQISHWIIICKCLVTCLRVIWIYFVITNKISHTILSFSTIQVRVSRQPIIWKLITLPKLHYWHRK